MYAGAHRLRTVRPQDVRRKNFLIMQWTRRIEVWLLLLAVVALAAWALWPGAEPGEGARLAEEETAAAAEGPRFDIRSIELERDYGNARLDIEVMFENRRPSALTMQPPEVRLLAGDDPDADEVPDFFLAIEPRPQIAGGGTQQVQLRYWLEAEHLHGPLVLHIGDHQRTIKTAEPVELDSFENRSRQRVRGGPWATR